MPARLANPQTDTTLEEFASNKLLDAKRLAEYWGVRTVDYAGEPALRIPYDPEGNFSRYRLLKTGGFRVDKGSKVKGRFYQVQQAVDGLYEAAYPILVITEGGNRLLGG